MRKETSYKLTLLGGSNVEFRERKDEGEVVIRNYFDLIYLIMMFIIVIVNNFEFFIIQYLRHHAIASI